MQFHLLSTLLFATTAWAAHSNTFLDVVKSGVLALKAVDGLSRSVPGISDEHRCTGLKYGAALVHSAKKGLVPELRYLAKHKCSLITDMETWEGAKEKAREAGHHDAARALSINLQ
jgi:hypothetical protein